MKITFFFRWKLNAIISIKPIQNTEGVDRTDGQVEGGGEMQLRVAESLLGQRPELMSLGSQFYFVCEFLITIIILFLWSVSISKRQRMTFPVQKQRGDPYSPLSLSNQHLKSKGSFRLSIFREKKKKSRAWSWSLSCPTGCVVQAPPATLPAAVSSPSV